MAARDIEHDAIHVGTRFRPMNLSAGIRCRALEMFEIEIEISQHAIANFGGGVTQIFEIDASECLRAALYKTSLGVA